MLLEHPLGAALSTRRMLMATVLAIGIASAGSAQPSTYLRWSASQAKQVGQQLRVRGRAGAWLGSRGLLSTNRAVNYKLRATWLTPDVIRATARLAQLTERLTDAEAEALVGEAEAAIDGNIAVLVEIDPNEGSGVVPPDWLAWMGPKGVGAGETGLVRGANQPTLRDIRALAGVFPRDYAYDVYWIVFPRVSNTGENILPAGTIEAELVVRIDSMEGRVSWRIPKGALN